MRRLVLVAVFGLVAGVTRAEAQEYTVVVNAANPVTSLTEDEVGRIFLKKTGRWPAGGAIAPVDLAKGAGARESFSKAVHGRGVNAIASYWQQQIFAGKDVPPPEQATEADVLAFVRDNAGAIGYVAAGTALGAGVRAVTVRR
jgi:ABC-type phosphate transport system substrate-binding protein